MIDNVVAGALIDPTTFGNAVVDTLNSVAFTSGTYTPTLTNCNVGTGGSAQNTAKYTFIGGPDTGDAGLLVVQGSIVLGTSGASMGTAPTASMPPGFTFDHPAATALYREGGCSMSAGASGTVQGLSNRAAGDTVQFVLQSASGSYVTAAQITATVPGTWTAGDALRWWYWTRVTRT